MSNEHAEHLADAAAYWAKRRAAREERLRKQATDVRDVPSPSHPWGLFVPTNLDRRAGSWRCNGFYSTQQGAREAGKGWRVCAVARARRT